MIKLIDETVEVGTTQAGWDFPKGHPTIKREVKRKDAEGKEFTTKVEFFTVPVQYPEKPLTIDDFFSEEYVDACKLAMDTMDDEDFIQAAYAGVKLAIGDAAKAPFKVKGNGKVGKEFETAMIWALDNEPAMASYKALVKTDREGARKQLIAAFAASK